MKVFKFGILVSCLSFLAACTTPPPDNTGGTVEKITIKGKILLAFEENTQERAVQILTQQQGSGAAVKYLPTPFEVTEAGVVKFKTDKTLAGLRIYDPSESLVIAGVKYTMADFTFTTMDRVFKGQRLEASLPLSKVKGNPMEFLIMEALKKSPVKQGVFAVKSVNFAGTDGASALLVLEVAP